jgi:hypothetical protein
MAVSAWGSLSGANVLIWIGIAPVSLSPRFSPGLNLVIFSVSKLRPEILILRLVYLFPACLCSESAPPCSERAAQEEGADIPRPVFLRR